MYIDRDAAFKGKLKETGLFAFMYANHGVMRIKEGTNVPVYVLEYLFCIFLVASSMVKAMEQAT